jgi:NAD(P)-dependent dehydrogenase (short-subunit alcohol dehydrogenase family)
MVEQSLKGRVCLVTGASRALGADIARSLAARGADVAVNYLESEDAARSLCRELRDIGARAEAFQADVGAPDQVTRLVSETQEMFGRIDVLVNNAGPYVDTPFLELPVDEFDRVMATNVRATYLAAREAGSRMKASGSGQVINIAATDALHRSSSVYGLAKDGVLYLTQALALEMAPEVRVNAVAPDLIADNEGMSEDLTRQSIEATPLGRLVTRAEVAEVVCQLCGPAFDSVTGQTIVMDGGRSIPQLRLGRWKVRRPG